MYTVIADRERRVWSNCLGGRVNIGKAVPACTKPSTSSDHSIQPPLPPPQMVVPSQNPAHPMIALLHDLPCPSLPGHSLPAPTRVRWP
jgi:hypothetical protein